MAEKQLQLKNRSRKQPNIKVIVVYDDAYYGPVDDSLDIPAPGSPGGPPAAANGQSIEWLVNYKFQGNNQSGKTYQVRLDGVTGPVHLYLFDPSKGMMDKGSKTGSYTWDVTDGDPSVGIT